MVQDSEKVLWMLWKKWKRIARLNRCLTLFTDGE